MSSRTDTLPRTAGLLLAVVCATIFFDALDLSITQVALPSIQAELLLSTSSLPWVATAYVVTYGGFLLLGGRAGDLLGCRPVFLAGLAIFGAASAICGFASDGGILIGARAVQGIGAALTVPTAVSMLATGFPEGPARNRAFATFTAAGASGFSAGLVLGGLLTDGLSWRWIFLAKVPVVAVTLIAAVVSVPRSEPRQRGGYDLAGALTATTGAVLLLYAITQAGNSAASLRTTALPLLVAVVALAAFVAIERRSAAPLLPPRLVRTRGLAAADAAALAVLAAPFGVSFVVTLYLQDVLHQSAMRTALTLLPGGIASALVGRYVAPRALDRFGLRAVYTAGLLLVAAGNALLLGLAPERTVGLIVVATLVSLGLGMGLAYPAATVGGVAGTDPANHGTAAGLNNTALQLGGGIGLAVVAASTSMQGVRFGVLAVTAIPLIGAAIALFGLRRAPDAE